MARYVCVYSHLPNGTESACNFQPKQIRDGMFGDRTSAFVKVSTTPSGDKPNIRSVDMWIRQIARALLGCRASVSAIFGVVRSKQWKCK